MHSWYPCPVPETIPNVAEININDNPSTTEIDTSSGVLPSAHRPHPIWNRGSLKYSISNNWAKGIPQDKRTACRRDYTHGVEVRDLPRDHFLHGEQGLFATIKFSKCDIVGEYTGRIVNSDVNGSYQFFHISTENYCCVFKFSYI